MRRRIKKKKKTVKISPIVDVHSDSSEGHLDSYIVHSPIDSSIANSRNIGGVGTRRFDFKANV
jgi:hypothetical protein